MKSRAIKKIMALVIIAALAVTMAVTLAACDNTGSGADIAILVPSADHGWTGAILSNANAPKKLSETTQLSSKIDSTSLK